MSGQESCFSAWLFWINVLVCIILVIVVVRVEKKCKRKIKKIEDELDDPLMKIMPLSRLRIKDLLKRHGAKTSKSATSKAKTE